MTPSATEWKATLTRKLRKERRPGSNPGATFRYTYTYHSGIYPMTTGRDSMSDFQTFINEERARLTTKRNELENQIEDLQTALAGIVRELRAITLYEDARTGKDTADKPAARGSRKDAVLAIIAANKGIEPKDIIVKLGGNVPKGGIHNLLGTLKKSGAITATGGKYSLA